MSPFSAMLTLYYLCDQAAAIRGLDPAEVALCMANYERLKMSFVEDAPARIGTPERAAQIRLGYRLFKAWEAANARRVVQMRATARRRIDVPLR